jgi:hypothetical protein
LLGTTANARRARLAMLVNRIRRIFTPLTSTSPRH